MPTQTAEVTNTVEIEALMQRISALPNNSLLKLADYVEELIEELEEEEDIEYIKSLTPEDYANAVPLEEVKAKYKASE